MKVKELIEALSKMPKESIVMAGDGLDTSDKKSIESVTEEEIDPWCHATGVYVLIKTQ